MWRVACSSQHGLLKQPTKLAGGLRQSLSWKLMAGKSVASGTVFVVVVIARIERQNPLA
jgi:hypothetical protein